MRHGSLSDSIRAFLFSRSEGSKASESARRTRLSREAGVEWHGRRYERDAWAAADPVNRALSAANSALYAILHAATVQLGYSPALGFVMEMSERRSVRTLRRHLSTLETET